MQYLCLIFESEALAAQRDEQAEAALIEEYGKFTDDIEATGNHIGGEALMPSETATTVRVRNGETLTTDGPFAETKEQLGGYYLIEAATLDEAISIAAKIPSAKDGCVEVRPVMKFE
ncbi:YciI family protein [Thalassotalea sp. 1_MG-2023]|uniref:YciI family protein n=1 Tax=Thalassotalea sp. 1_MG-2023 TaxID=3062680 RepID=UPI0026E345FA|nr:YciI family protein [Thalassotalea sp. 1_MG-2023]MDO6428141.1 YciI family protein [Thalassotalea sp. 1_MG-2023]